MFADHKGRRKIWEVTQAIQGCTDAAKLDAWFDAAVDAADLEQFRQNAGL